MATKSRLRKKNGKPVKYKPKPKGISKTQMKKIMEMIQEQQKLSQDGPKEIPETRDERGELLISPEFIKKMNVISSEDIKSGPVLSEINKSAYQEKKEVLTTEKEEENTDQGPVSSEI